MHRLQDCLVYVCVFGAPGMLATLVQLHVGVAYSNVGRLVEVDNILEVVRLREA